MISSLVPNLHGYPFPLHLSNKPQMPLHTQHTHMHSQGSLLTPFRTPGDNHTTLHSVGGFSVHTPWCTPVLDSGVRRNRQALCSGRKVRVCRLWDDEGVMGLVGVGGQQWGR